MISQTKFHNAPFHIYTLPEPKTNISKIAFPRVLDSNPILHVIADKVGVF